MLALKPVKKLAPPALDTLCNRVLILACGPHDLLYVGLHMLKPFFLILYIHLLPETGHELFNPGSVLHTAYGFTDVLLYDIFRIIAKCPHKLLSHVLRSLSPDVMITVMYTNQWIWTLKAAV